MKLAFAIPFVVLAIVALSSSAEDVNGEFEANQAYLIEGSGYAVTKELINTSQIDLLMATERQVGSRIPVIIEDGFITLNEMDFVVSDLTGSILRDGRFIRLVGTAEDSSGNEVSLSIFGRLIQHSDEGSVYSFTGRLNEGDESNKIIYTTKISGLTSGILSTTPTSETVTTSEQVKEKEIIIHIRKGSSDPSQFSYIDIDVGQPKVRGFYSQDRIIIEPGTTITWINDDMVSHSISSGTGLGSSTRASQGIVKICDESQLETFKFDSGISFKGDDCTFTLDGRVKSGEILPGKSWSITIEEQGFYRLADVDYIWMTSTIYAFPEIDQDIIRRGPALSLN